MARIRYQVVFFFFLFVGSRMVNQRGGSALVGKNFTMMLCPLRRSWSFYTFIRFILFSLLPFEAL